MLKAVFRIDPTLSNKFHLGINFNINEKLLVNAEFDTGNSHTITSNFSTNKDKDVIISDFFDTIDIPEKATKITITSDDNIIGYKNNYSCIDKNPSIISVEEFTSDTIVNCDYMFGDLYNLKEVKNVNLNWDKITYARSMCYNWRSFNGILPENFCSNMRSLIDASHMFCSWKSFNQRLPDNFCSNMSSLNYADYMFDDWKSYNQELPENFCSNIVSLRQTNNMFRNWHSYSHKLPDTFFPDTSSYIEKSLFMFWGWYNCYNTPKYYLPEYLHDYKQKDIDKLNELLKKEEIIDYQLLSKLKNEKYFICIKNNSIDHYILIDNGNITPISIYVSAIFFNITEAIRNKNFITINIT